LLLAPLDEKQMYCYQQEAVVVLVVVVVVVEGGIPDSLVAVLL